MKKCHLIAATCALLLAGCAHSPSAPDPVRPQVFVVDGRFLVVDAEPLVFTRRGAITITWHLPKGYTFDQKQGIVIEGLLLKQTRVLREGEVHQTYVLDPKQSEITCGPGKDRSEFSCLNRNTKPGRYKYTIHLEGAASIEALDPWIMNN